MPSVQRDEWAEPVDKNDPKSVRKMRRIAEKLVECAMKGEGWAISQVADRIDGRPKQESDFSVASTRYVVEVPPQLSLEEWEKKYALPTAQRFNAVPRSDGPP